MSTYRKTDGTYTKSVKAYVASWNAVKIPLEKELGVTTIGFDPDFLVKKEGCKSTEIPLWLALKIIERAQK